MTSRDPQSILRRFQIQIRSESDQNSSTAHVVARETTRGDDDDGDDDDDADDGDADARAGEDAAGEGDATDATDDDSRAGDDDDDGEGGGDDDGEGGGDARCGVSRARGAMVAVRASSLDDVVVVPGDYRRWRHLGRRAATGTGVSSLDAVSRARRSRWVPRVPSVESEVSFHSRRARGRVHRTTADGARGDDPRMSSRRR